MKKVIKCSSENSEAWNQLHLEQEKLSKQFDQMRRDRIRHDDYRWKSALKKEKELDARKKELTAQDNNTIVTNKRKLSAAITKVSGLEPIKTRTTSVRGYRPTVSGSFEIEYYDLSDNMDVYFYRDQDKVDDVVSKLSDLGYNIIHQPGASSFQVSIYQNKITSCTVTSSESKGRYSRMEITCSKRDDIIKQRDEYQADYDRRKALFEEDSQRFRKAEYDQDREVEEEIKRRLNVLQDGLNITVSRGWSRGLEVKIDNGDNPHKEGIALSWNYSAKITEDGEVKAETGSWSGLNAITTEQLENLHATVETLEAINAIDWKELLDVATPNYEDYFTHKNPQYDKDRPKPDFDQMLFEADAEESMEKNILLHEPEKSSYDKHYYYKVVKATPKFYKVVVIPPYVVEDAMQRGDLNLLKEHIDDKIKYARNMDKAKLRKELGKDYEMINY